MRKWLPALAFLSLVSLFLGVYVGSVGVPASQVSTGIAYGVARALHLTTTSKPPKFFVIIWEIRLPRVLLAYLVGLALASAGVAAQALFKNPLADPYIIGVSAGASIGAAIASVYAPSQMGPFALVFAVFSVLVVYSAAKVDGNVPVDTLLLAGVAYGFMASAVTWYIILKEGERARVTWMWMMGSFNGASWANVGQMAVVTLLGTGFLIWKWRELNLLLLGEESVALGLDVSLYRKLTVGAIALLTAFAVSTAGIIGFVGLVAPHIMRILLGPNHRRLTPAAALLGGVLLVTADLVARVLSRPTEIPVGIVTALMGAPFFLYLLRKHRKGVFTA